MPVGTGAVHPQDDIDDLAMVLRGAAIIVELACTTYFTSRLLMLLVYQPRGKDTLVVIVSKPLS
jgi:hypothetical protein